VFIVEHFLSALECDHIIAKARPLLRSSKVVGKSSEESSKVSRDRTSESMSFPTCPDDQILQKLQVRIAEITGFPIEHGETLQVVHYEAGEEYKPHYDYFNPSTQVGNYHIERGGQRIATFMIYLHTTEDGGETIFPKAGLKIKPVKGTAVLFYNCLPSGLEDAMTFHAGAPVLQGEKWIITKWLRAKKLRGECKEHNHEGEFRRVTHW
jgi:prolyl 4-hydroxylase